MILLYSLSGHAQGIDGIIQTLKNVDCFKANVNYEVLMSLQADVNYSLKLTSVNNPDDTLAPCDYLIDWTLEGVDGNSHGFNAYFAGNAYIMRGERMQEYHYDWDSIPFRPHNGVKALPGIQIQAQFASLLPQFIADELALIASNTEEYRYKLHPDTLIHGQKVIAVDGVMELHGTTCKEFLYVFDKASGMPVFVELENNPGALAEQTITARYSDISTENGCQAISEETLRETYPDAFEKYRESNYAIENLPGQRLPSFALPTTTGERYSRQAGDKFRNVTLVVLIDASSSFAAPTVKDIRNAVDNLPVNADVIWAFVGTNIDEIEHIIPAVNPGEHLLINAKSLARDCGAGSYPVTIITRPDGIVSDVVLGYNNNLSSAVIQKVVLIAK